jgi:hypothetical protein
LKLERWHQSVKRACIRPLSPLDLEDARRLVADYVRRYNHERLHGALGYIAPADKLAGKADEIHATRDRKLAAARAARRQKRAASEPGTQSKASLGPGAAMSTPGLRERQEINAAQPLPSLEDLALNSNLSLPSLHS